MCIYVYVFRSHLQSTLRDRKERALHKVVNFFQLLEKGQHCRLFAAKSVGVKPKIWINYRTKQNGLHAIYIY